MKKYEAIFIVKPDLSEEAKKNLFRQINDVVIKNSGVVTQGALWAEKKKLIFPIKKYTEGVYYLLNFSLNPLAIKEIHHAYKLNENILRVLITLMK
ncbi:MAG: 30S ribosomal protein S6 [Candidatus Omnitrophica bacterium CG08_land_8_20_14_0_20_41_16]|uniref:Small ribosomal subunit protein bS6 n=1 Tax=Candidatus Sherwoodlollariibacterium unditelluris TaxID=1974757 RepID=A0A2G9YIL9_9BACT|nr:MAG: 30S ribosomal protein S6 [Candidatus Omnitrophica bacterium CG23_combo_of_CG06-09_8_20_14_all_41_10]PIS33632.1 MAG: 30S ribosomal protein S6 [Candidatus Omnitrophica bacterium CG08_land_8_20_14_0_20_41_16]